MPTAVRRRGAWLCAAALLWPACTQDHAPSAARGQQIYLHGVSPSGDPLSVTLPLFGAALRTVPASRYACVQCHGPEGLPKTEAGIAMPDIRPHRLAAELLASGNQRRTRRPYDQAAIGRAVRFGRDPSGNALAALMPRFDISDRDLADLCACLAELGREAAPGVTATEVVLATIVGDDEAGRAALATLRAFAADTNAAGGIYGRRLRIDAAAPADAAVGAAAAGQWLGVAAAFRLPPTFAPALPVVGAVADDPLLEPPLDADVFWLQPAQVTQLRVAIDHWCTVLMHDGATFALLLPDGIEPATARTFTAQLADQVQRHQGARLVPLATTPPRDDGDPTPLVVLIAGCAAASEARLPELLRRGDVAAVYQTGRLPADALRDLDAEALARLRLLLPVPLPDAADPAVAAFRAFLARHRLDETHLQTRLTALVAGATFAEGLKRCGAPVTRQRLREAIGALQRFRPGLSAPISYDPNRRIGARGAQVVGIHPRTRELVPQAAWSEPR